ncbi:hypothetical protein TWF696_000573 [Orbilia brochopaga]|uniref:Uncharacterized protein n=1 Tax=Orbilia brochopaga TaxID=3140254 RepID=A0AAV9VCW9_9PEZI
MELFGGDGGWRVIFQNRRTGLCLMNAGNNHDANIPSVDRSLNGRDEVQSLRDMGDILKIGCMHAQLERCTLCGVLNVEVQNPRDQPIPYNSRCAIRSARKF